MSDAIYDPNVDYDSLEQHTYDDAPGEIFYTCPKCGGVMEDSGEREFWT